MVERLIEWMIWLAMILVVAILMFWAWAEVKAEHRTVWVPAYCYKFDDLRTLIEAERKSDDAWRATDREMRDAGKCKVHHPTHYKGVVIGSEPIERGRQCDWEPLLVRLPMEAKPVWALKPHKCGRAM